MEIKDYKAGANVFFDSKRRFYLDEGKCLAVERLPKKGALTEEYAEEKDEVNARMVAALQSFGYAANNEGSTGTMLEKLVGMRWVDARRSMKSNGKSLQKQMATRNKNDVAWLKLKAMFDGRVTGLANEIDYRIDGFEVRILLTSRPLKENAQFAADRMDDLVKYVGSELANNEEFQRKNRGRSCLRNVYVLKSAEIVMYFAYKPKVVTERAG